METGETKASRAAPPSLLGGRYELGELRGFGGMAEVWRARDLRLNREVAVKVLSGAGARDPSRRRRIEREARALAALNHANIVAVFDYGEESVGAEQVLPYIVMELVDGPDLHEYLETEGRLDSDEAHRLLRGVLSAVGRAHDAGIVHGDLKPANVLMAEDGPKVGDFGVARILDEETGTTTVAATPTFAAPEVLRGGRPTAASDLYSVACLAYQMLTGRPPYEGSNAWEIATKHMDSPLPSVRVSRSEVPVSLDEAIRRGMQKDPRLRHPSAEAFAEALGGAQPIRRAATAGAQATTPMTAPAGVPPQPTEALPPRPGRSERLRERWLTPGRSKLAAIAAAVVGAAILLFGVLSLGTDAVSVPDVRGQTDDAAALTLHRAGFVVSGISYTAITEGEPGLVIRTIPQAGESVEPGSEVHIVAGLQAATPEPSPPPDDDRDDDRDEDRGRGRKGKGNGD